MVGTPPAAAAATPASLALYTGLMALVIVQRLVELAISRQHLRRARAAGGIERGASHYKWMVLLHVAFLASCLGEAWVRRPPLRPPLAILMLAALAGAFALRVWAIRTLGDRWTTRVIAVPGQSLVVAGPYRWVRHPNYLAVLVETIALPLVHGGWITALIFTPLQAALLAWRIGIEESALDRDHAYARAFSSHFRLLPWRGRPRRDAAPRRP
jgi:methyltransferase